METLRVSNICGLKRKREIQVAMSRGETNFLVPIHHSLIDGTC